MVQIPCLLEFEITSGSPLCKIPPLVRGVSAPMVKNAHSSGVAPDRSNGRKVNEMNKFKKT